MGVHMRIRVNGAVVAVLLVGILAAPASAGVEVGAIVLNGVAVVGAGPNGIDGVPDNPREHDPIPQSGVCAPDTSKGLHYPGLYNKHDKANDAIIGFQVNKRAYYYLDTVVDAVQFDANGGSRGVTTASLDLCGVIDPGYLGVGAACDSSTGHSGRGKLIFGDGTVYDVTEVQWLAAVGGALPVYGYIQEVTGTGKKTKVDTKSPFYGMLRAFGGESQCVGMGSSSARAFPVQGVVITVGLLK